MAMPNLTIASLATDLNEGLSQGRVASASVGNKAMVPGWDIGLPSTAAPYLTGVMAEGATTSAVLVTASGTPAIVAEGGAKPTLATVSTGTLTIGKHAGLATFPTERQVWSEGLIAQVVHVLTGQALISLDKSVQTAITAASTQTSTAATWQTAILSGIGKVIGVGGNPQLLLLNAVDYATILDATTAPGGFSHNPQEGYESLFGLRIVPCAGFTSGTAYVLDPAAITVGWRAPDPIVAIVDPYSGLATNAVTTAVELFAGLLISHPNGIVKVTKTP